MQLVKCKALEAMCFERLVTGRSDLLDREEKMINMMLSLFEEDGCLAGMMRSI